MYQHDAHTMIDFAARWASFGGAGDEDIWTTFGLSANDYRRRLRDSFDLVNASLFDDVTKRRLQAYAWHRDTAPAPMTGQ